MRNTLAILPGVEAHPSGALWLPLTKTAIVADIHLGYSWAQRRRGELGPLADARSREKLFQLRDEMRPDQFIFLGDLVHAPRPCAPERQWIEETLLQLGEEVHLIAVRGNHDRAFAREFGHLPIKTLEAWSNDQMTAIHGDRLIVALPEHHTLAVGHLHPSLPVKDGSGAGRKLPIFLVNQHCLVLPAFSPFAGGYDVSGGLPAELTPFFRNEAIQAVAVTGTRAVSLGPLRRAVEHLSSKDVSAPSQFRGRHRRQSPVPLPTLAPDPAAK